MYKISSNELSNTLHDNVREIYRMKEKIRSLEKENNNILNDISISKHLEAGPVLLFPGTKMYSDLSSDDSYFVGKEMVRISIKYVKEGSQWKMSNMDSLWFLPFCKKGCKRGHGTDSHCKCSYDVLDIPLCGVSDEDIKVSGSQNNISSELHTVKDCVGSFAITSVCFYVLMDCCICWSKSLDSKIKPVYDALLSRNKDAYDKLTESWKKRRNIYTMESGKQYVFERESKDRMERNEISWKHF